MLECFLKPYNFSTLVTLTKMWASHEVITALLWIFAMDFSCNGVKLGELMSMEAVIMIHVTEGSCAVGHALEFLFINLLRLHIEVVDLITFGGLWRNLNTTKSSQHTYCPYMFSIMFEPLQTQKKTTILQYLWKRLWCHQYSLAWDTPLQHPSGQEFQGKLQRYLWDSPSPVCACSSWRP